MPKVLYIGFGILPFIRGGAIFYQDSLIEEINAHGWETICFFAGPRYTIMNKLHLKTWYKNKVKYIELCNPPYTIGTSNNPEQQCYNPAIEELIRKILKKERPDIIHFQELQMHPASLIDVVVDLKIPSLKTMHNYYDICSQRDLMYEGKELCYDFDNGKKCARCMTTLPANSVSFKERIRFSLSAVGLYRPLSDFYRIIKSSAKHKNKQNSTPYSHKIAAYDPEQYRYRRQFFIDRLNKLDAIHCSSRRSAEIFINCGLSRARIKIIPNSTKSIDKISSKPLRNNHYPVVFGYIGGKAYVKGFEVLLDAFSMLDQTKAKLMIWNLSEAEIPDQYLNLNIELGNPWEAEEINQVFQKIDVGVMPSVWEEVFGLIGLEWLAAKIPVIGSNIGGIPEWLKNGENGFLVPPNNAKQLAQKMELFVNNPGLIAEIQKQIKPQKTFKEYINEIIYLYEEIIANRRQ